MDVRALLARYAAGRPRPLVVAAPGGTAARLAVEPALRRRGWQQATTPAETGLLLVCGEPGTALADAIETVWRDMPGPRARVRVTAAASDGQVVAELDRGMAELADVAAQRADAVSRLAAGPWAPPEQEDHMAGGHNDHDGHGHHMGTPAGLAMAGRAADRDGLKLDVLRVPLGPVLPHWPAGLQVVMTLQGDVVQAAEVAVMDGGGGSSFWDEPWLAAKNGERTTQGTAARRRAAAHLDSMARLLAVAGWPAAAARARRLRDDVLAGRPGRELVAPYGRFASRTDRSRLLRWMTRDLGVIDDDAVDRHGLIGPAARYPGDVAARLRGWLRETSAALAHADDEALLSGDAGPRGPVTGAPSASILELLPTLLAGSEFSAARLIVASLDPDLDQPAFAAVNPGAAGA